MIKRLIIAAIILSIVFIGVTTVQAQSTLDSIRITGTDYADTFPEFSLTAMFKDKYGTPVSGILKEYVILKENNQEIIEFDMQEMQLGSRTALVLDLGSWVNAKSTTDEIIRDEMKTIALAVVENMNTTDLVEVVVVYGSEPIVVQNFTNDKETLRQAITGLDWESEGFSFGIEAIRLAKEELINAPDDLQKNMVFLSAGIMNRDRNSGSEESIALEMDSRSIPLFSVYIPRYTSDNYYYLFKDMAESTRGEFFEYSGLQSTKDLISLVNLYKTQYQFSYRTTDGKSTNRTIELSYDAGFSPSDSIPIQVAPDLVAPAMVIVGVNNGEPVYRRTEDLEYDLDSVPQTSVPISVEISNMGNREIARAVLFVNGNELGELTRNEQGFAGTWGIRNIVETSSVSIQVIVYDEFGDQHPSETKTVTIEVTLPVKTLTPPVNPMCANLDGIPGLQQVCIDSGLTYITAGIILLLIVICIVLAILWFRNPQQFKEGVSKIADGVTKVYDRLTNRIRNEEPKARLVALRGIPEGERVEFDLFEVTPIGRSPEHSELIFENDNVSRLHCIIKEQTGGNWVIEDQNSSNGTYVDGKRLAQFSEHIIKSGTMIELGQVERGGIKFEFEIIDVYETDDELAYDLDDEVTYVEDDGYEQEDPAENPTRQTRHALDTQRVKDRMDDPSDPSNQSW